MTDFTCNVDNKVYRSACEDLSEYRSTGYCVLHFPGEDKKDDFEKVKGSKLASKDYNFQGTVFPEGTADFKRIKFDAEANFSGATFCGVADFSRAIFSSAGTHFAHAHFAGNRTLFTGAQFSGGIADFLLAQFSKNTYFYDVQFTGEAEFWFAQFSGEITSFSGARFSGARTHFAHAKFTGERTYFTGAQFSGRQTDFSGATFSGETADFLLAQFSGRQADFMNTQFGSTNTYFRDTQFSSERTSFWKTQFSGVTDFKGATFNCQPTFQDATLRDATFENTVFQRGADFSRTSFRVTDNGRTDFRRAIFRGEAYFKETEFEGYTDFYRSNFLDAVKFIGYEAEDGNGKEDKPKSMFTGELARRVWVSFKYARVERPELFSFYALLLRPGWFANVGGVRGFGFSNVEWYTIDGNTQLSISDNSASVYHEASALLAKPWPQESQYSHAKYQMERTYRELALNAEENHRYEDASRFRYLSMEARRLNVAPGRPAFLKLIWWYRALSGYGEKPRRSALWLAGILTIFALLYLALGLGLDVGPAQLARESHSTASPFKALWQGLMYSLAVMTRQNSSLDLETPILLRTMVWFEGIVGPLQIALLALALRRRFMRSS